MDKLPCSCAAVRAKRGELHMAATLQYNRGREKKKKSRGQAVLMLIGIITGVFKLSGGGSVTLCKLKQAHSKAPVNGG